MSCSPGRADSSIPGEPAGKALRPGWARRGRSESFLWVLMVPGGLRKTVWPKTPCGFGPTSPGLVPLLILPPSQCQAVIPVQRTSPPAEHFLPALTCGCLLSTYFAVPGAVPGPVSLASIAEDGLGKRAFQGAGIQQSQSGFSESQLKLTLSRAPVRERSKVERLEDQMGQATCHLGDLPWAQFSPIKWGGPAHSLVCGRRPRKLVSVLSSARGSASRQMSPMCS